MELNNRVEVEQLDGSFAEVAAFESFAQAEEWCEKQSARFLDTEYQLHLGKHYKTPKVYRNGQVIQSASRSY